MNVWADFRELYDAVLGHEGAVFASVLLPWAEHHPQAHRWLADFAARDAAPVPAATDDDLWNLYALSRVNQILLLGFQQGRADGTDWPGPNITLADYTAFWQRLGLTVEPERPFAPFYHEIVTVEEDGDADAPVSLIGTYWPCLMLGPLLFSRAGACVTGGANRIDKTVAETSPLYWTYRRKNRLSRDLSQGWGSNSQWRTRFRRDYRLHGRFWHNVDGSNDLSTPASPDRDGLTPDERRELLINRCFVRTDKPDDDLWPYDDRLSE